MMQLGIGLQLNPGKNEFRKLGRAVEKRGRNREDCRSLLLRQVDRPGPQ